MRRAKMGDLRMVREIPVAIGLDNTLIFASHITSLSVTTEEGNLQLIIALSNGDTYFLDNSEIAEFISQFPLNIFAKSPELAKLHAENSSLI
jgi:hypothetical protein